MKKTFLTYPWISCQRPTGTALPNFFKRPGPLPNLSIILQVFTPAWAICHPIRQLTHLPSEHLWLVIALIIQRYSQLSDMNTSSRKIHSYITTWVMWQRAVDRLFGRKSLLENILTTLYGHTKGSSAIFFTILAKVQTIKCSDCISKEVAQSGLWHSCTDMWGKVKAKEIIRGACCINRLLCLEKG